MVSQPWQGDRRVRFSGRNVSRSQTFPRRGPPSAEADPTNYRIKVFWHVHPNPIRFFFASHSAFSRLFSVPRALPLLIASISNRVRCID